MKKDLKKDIFIYYHRRNISMILMVVVIKFVLVHGVPSFGAKFSNYFIIMCVSQML